MSRPKPFLLEIALEPLPPSAAQTALAQLPRIAADLFKRERLEHSGLAALGTHRRLALFAESLSERSETVEKWEFGPPASRLKDDTGAYSAAAAGFAAKWGLKPELLEIRTSPKGEEALAARRILEGESALKILARILPELLGALRFDKSMRWDGSGARFSRPVRGLAALHGKAVIPFSFAGLRSGRKIAGPWRGVAKTFSLADAASYRQALKTRLVIADPAERREALLQSLRMKVVLLGAEPAGANALLEETLYMAEHPSAVLGCFKESYLTLPEELLVVVIETQMKCFPVRDAKGALLPQFLAVRDGSSEGDKAVREGFEHVLEARLKDAVFFFERDKKTTLESKGAAFLPGLAYHKDLGSVAAKRDRVERLALWLCRNASDLTRVDEEAVRKIARLAYADLVTELVREFPELQGCMGAAYARHDGEPESVCRGIAEFYWPLGAGSPLPSTTESALASLADKIETVASGFSVGLNPTASADPFGLRRKAIGALRIILEKGVDVDLREAVRGVYFSEEGARAESRAERFTMAVLEFFWGRLEGLWQDRGYPIDEIRAVKPHALTKPLAGLRRLEALHEARKLPDFEAIAVSFKRAANIIRQSGAANGSAASQGGENPAMEKAEELLSRELVLLGSDLAPRIEKGRFGEAFSRLVAVRPLLDRFFAEVLVMAEDPSLRERRLALLRRLIDLFDSVADIAEIQVSK